MAVSALRQLAPSLDEQHACVADVTRPTLGARSEAASKVGFIALAGREARTGRLGSTDAAAAGTAVDLGLVATKHLSFVWI